MTLKERREALGMSQSDVGRKVGAPQPAIYAYEHGKWKPKYFRALRLAELFGCSIEEIMDGCGEGG